LLPINISRFYKLLHLINIFLQIGKTFFTSGSYYIRKYSEVTKNIHHRKEDKKMKKRKKYLIIGAVILSVAVLAGLGISAACGPHGHWQKGFHSRFHSEDIADFVLWKMDRRVKDLDLNETQKQEYAKIKEQVKANLSEVMEERREFHRMMHDEINKENPDVNRVADLAKDRLKDLPDLIGKNLDLIVKFYNMLDESQKAQVLERLRWRMGGA